MIFTLIVFFMNNLHPRILASKGLIESAMAGIRIDHWQQSTRTRRCDRGKRKGREERTHWAYELYNRLGLLMIMPCWSNYGNRFPNQNRR